MSGRAPQDAHRLQETALLPGILRPLLPQRRLKPYLAALSQLQEELGQINDYVTAETLITEALDGHPAGPVHGWICGRHELLISEVPEVLQTWLAQNAP